MAQRPRLDLAPPGVLARRRDVVLLVMAYAVLAPAEGADVEELVDDLLRRAVDPHVYLEQPDLQKAERVHAGRMHSAAMQNVEASGFYSHAMFS